MVYKIPYTFLLRLKEYNFMNKGSVVMAFAWLNWNLWLWMKLSSFSQTSFFIADLVTVDYEWPLNARPQISPVSRASVVRDFESLPPALTAKEVLSLFMRATLQNYNLVVCCLSHLLHELCTARKNANVFNNSNHWLDVLKTVKTFLHSLSWKSCFAKHLSSMADV